MSTTVDEEQGLRERLDAPGDERSIHQRMIAILSELPAIGKTQRNEQQKFMYRGHDDVLNALNPLLATHGVFVVPRVRERVTAERTTARGNTMYEVNLLVEYVFYGAQGDSIRATAWGEGTDSGDKSTNKAMTMAFKNVLAQAFAVSTAELSDADASSPEETTRGGERQQRTAAPREFDPGRDLLPQAIVVRKSEDADAVRLAQRDLAPAEPWSEIEDYLALHVFEKVVADLTPAERREWWHRLANAIVRANDLAGPGDFPPPSAEQVKTAYAWAFKGVVLALDGDVTASGAEDDAELAQEAADAAGRDS